MENSNKALTIIFVILFVVLLAEVSYIAYSSFYKESSDIKANLPNSTGQVEEKTTINAPALPERRGVQAIDESVLSILKVANKGVITSSQLTNTYEGKITEFEYDVTSDKSIKIVISGPNGAQNGFTFGGDDDGLSNDKDIVIVRSLPENKTEPISLSDIKIGDSVIIEINADLLKDMVSYITRINITVVNQ